jgi:hypothetical protein
LILRHDGFSCGEPERPRTATMRRRNRSMIQFFDPTFVLVTSLDDGWRKVTLNLSSLPSQDLLLDFFRSGWRDI